MSQEPLNVTDPVGETSVQPEQAQADQPQSAASPEKPAEQPAAQDPAAQESAPAPAEDAPAEDAEAPAQPEPATEPQSEPAPEPENKPAPQREAKPLPEPAPEIDADTQAEIDAAMAAATAVPDEAPTPAGDAAAATAQPGDAASADAPKGKVRGPRLVQGGREYRKGLVVSVGPDDIFIEFGPKELGVLPRVQFKDKDGNEPDLPVVGGEVEVAINKFDANESIYICSRPGAVQKADWELLEPGQVVEARCTGVNKGGLELEVAGHRAFMPASRVDVRRIEDLSVFVGEKMTCRVDKVDRFGKGNIVLSRRELVKAEMKKNKEELKDKLTEGQTVQGVVRTLMPFGAFLDLGGIDALLHIGDMSHDRIRKPEDVDGMKEGATLTVQILKLDWEKDRHSVGLKQLQDDPFAVATEQIVEGAELSGRVTKLMEFGCFVEVAPGVEGLVHISEVDWRRVEKISDAVQPDQVVQVKVLKVDPSDRRISLSIKQLKDRPAPPKGSGGPGGRGRGRGRGEQDTRSADDILKETPELRRLREKAKQRDAQKGSKKSKAGGGGLSGGGLGDAGGLGIGLGDLKL